MNKIALIIPYFGKYPAIIDAWIKTIQYNPEIDFMVFSDNSPSEERPENLIWHRISFEEVKELAQRCFDFPIWLETAYKLCDYRPAYGLIFKDFLNGYDFWGHCDPDVVWGKFSDYLTEDILNFNDRIYSRGHLCLYRNNEKMNNLFKEDHGFKDCYDYRRVFTRRFGCDFDEWGTKYGLGMSTICKRYQISSYDKVDFADLSYSYYDFRMATPDGFDAKIFVSTPNGLYGYKLESGKLVKKEYLYVHLQKRSIEMPEFKNIGDTFVIVPNRFIKYESEEQLIELINDIPNHTFYAEWYKKRIKRVFSKLNEGALQELIYRKLCILGIIKSRG